ncbi:MAG: 3-deoxy-8-phosphooctulonate synthase [Synergistaceae bacterium]|jgi:2-dehydro-3-deoxyphosphooctonate aldolase (KDO 8-P synthase)|nr:3-deoxy-8-phosphooctulonate synthase [Synergistaceae bacterium]
MGNVGEFAKQTDAFGENNKGGFAGLEIGENKLVIAAGPCILESLDLGLRVAVSLSEACMKRGLGYIFKASFDKANRTSIRGERGPGLDMGLEWLARIKSETGVPVLTDIHEPHQAAPVAEVADMLQIPAFLCRQTDLLVAASRTGRPLNVKKAQFMAPEDMAGVLEKCRESGASGVVLCERGTSFGYRQLVVDFRSLVIMRGLGAPVMFDATHSVQRPGGLGTSSGGDRRFVLPLVRAALAIGVDSLFLEVHPDPEHAMSDGPNMVPLGSVDFLLDQISELDRLTREVIGFAGLEWAEK